MASKTYIYRDLVSGAEMFNVANPHVSHPKLMNVLQFNVTANAQL